VTLQQVFIAVVGGSRFELSDFDPLMHPLVDDADVHLQKAYDWHFERTMTAIRLVFGAAGAVVLALVTAVLKQGSDPTGGQIAALIASAGLFAGIGLLLSVRLRNLHREYVATLSYLERQRWMRQVLWNLGFG